MDDYEEFDDNFYEDDELFDDMLDDEDFDDYDDYDDEDDEFDDDDYDDDDEEGIDFLGMVQDDEGNWVYPEDLE